MALRIVDMLVVKQNNTHRILLLYFLQDFLKIEYSFLATFDKYILETAEDRPNIEYLYQLVYNKHSEVENTIFFILYWRKT